LPQTAQPAFHLGDLLALAAHDAVGELAQLGPVGVGVDQLGHLDGLLVVGDHALGEEDVGVAWRRLGRRGALFLVPGALVAGGQQEGSGQREQDPSHGVLL
jgi:hypothetical protein